MARGHWSTGPLGVLESGARSGGSDHGDIFALHDCEGRAALGRRDSRNVPAAHKSVLPWLTKLQRRGPNPRGHDGVATIPVRPASVVVKIKGIGINALENVVRFQVNRLG